MYERNIFCGEHGHCKLDSSVISTTIIFSFSPQLLLNTQQRKSKPYHLT